MKMKRIFLMLLVFLCFSCGKQEAIILLKSRYHQYEFETNPKTAAELKQLSRQNNLDFQFQTINTDKSAGEYLEEIYQVIENSRARYILLDPILTAPPESIIRKYPARLFASFRVKEQQNFPNLCLVQYTKAAAFQTAGRICGLLLAQQHPKLVEKQAPGEKLKLGLLTSHEALSDGEEIDLFSTEFSREYNSEDLLTEEVRNLYDRNEINRKIEDLLYRGAVIIFPRLAVSNAYCLEVLMKKGGLVILENWSFTGKQIDELFLFSINDLFQNAVAEILSNGSSGQTGQVAWDSGIVTVDSRIIWGKAIEKIPLEISPLLDH